SLPPGYSIHRYIRRLHVGRNPENGDDWLGGCQNGRCPDGRVSWLMGKSNIMDLFGTGIDKTANILPRDGEVNYFGKLFTTQEATRYLHLLLDEIDWKNDEAVIFGRLIRTKRMVAWYGDSAFSYTYS